MILLLSDIKNSKSLNQVKWVRDNLDGYLNFYSVSGDGRVTNWTLVKNCLWHSDQLTISFAKQLTNLAIHHCFLHRFPRPGRFADMW